MRRRQAQKMGRWPTKMRSNEKRNDGSQRWRSRRTRARTHKHILTRTGTQAHTYFMRERQVKEATTEGIQPLRWCRPSSVACVVRFSSSLHLCFCLICQARERMLVRPCVCACVRTSIWLLFRFSMSLRTSLSLSLSPRVHVCFVCVHLLFFPSLPRMCERPRMFSAWGRRGGGGGE